MERDGQFFLPRNQESTSTDKKTTVLKLVPTFSGEGDVTEWLEKVDMICRLNDVTADKDVLYVITLRLTGEAYRVVQQMEPIRRARKREVVAALTAAYEVSVHDAYDLFRARRWKEGESVDGYLSTLRKLADLSGGAEERMLMAAFVSGLPDRVKDVVRASVGADQLTLASAVAQARQIINKMGLENAEKCMVVAERKKRNERPRSGCYQCGKQGHVRKDCPDVLCFKCQKKGHLSFNCPGNDASE